MSYFSINMFLLHQASFLHWKFLFLLHQVRFLHLFFWFYWNHA